MAKWGQVWSGSNLKYWQKRAVAKDIGGYCPPMPVKKRIGGDYPHLQPFFRNRAKKELQAIAA